MPAVSPSTATALPLAGQFVFVPPALIAPGFDDGQLLCTAAIPLGMKIVGHGVTSPTHFRKPVVNRFPRAFNPVRFLEPNRDG
jgi:hypothetical protein